MQMKQSIREVRFNSKAKHPLIKKFSKNVSPYAWKLIEGGCKYLLANPKRASWQPFLGGFSKIYRKKSICA
jgi:hypothetical protein